MPAEMPAFLAFSGGIGLPAILLRTALTMFCAGVIGMERGRANQAAGMRTYMLVSLGAAIVMMTGQSLYIACGTGDPARLGAQVISGIGFLGAGSIIISGKMKVRGLTTAAGLWVSACIGLSIGSGFIAVGLLSTLAVAVIMTFMKRVEDAFSNQFCVYIELDDSLLLQALSDELCKKRLYISEIRMNEFGHGTQKLILGIRSESRCTHADVMSALRGIDKIRYVEFVV